MDSLTLHSLALLCLAAAASSQTQSEHQTGFAGTAAGKSPAMTRARVDLPQPDSPMTPTTWPRSTATFMSRKMVTSGLPPGPRP